MPFPPKPCVAEICQRNLFLYKGKAFCSLSGPLEWIHAVKMAADEEETKVEFLGLKERALASFSEHKESRLVLVIPTRSPIALMAHFSTLHSLMLISLMFLLSSPEWLLLYDTDNLCNVLFHVQLQT